MMGVYEYCAPQRQGKSTLMMADLVVKVLPEFSPEDIFANFQIMIDGVNCMDNSHLIEQILKFKYDRVRHKVILFDEVGQELKARGYMDKLQTEVVGYAWQMPKMDTILMYCSNPGNSADIILRDAAWQSIITRYVHGETREEDYIIADVIFNYDLKIQRGIIVRGVHTVQQLFDSFAPIF